MMTGKPEWVSCIRKSHQTESHLTWCGREHRDTEFILTGLDHASCLNTSRIQPCDDCIRAAVVTLQGLSYKP